VFHPRESRPPQDLRQPAISLCCRLAVPRRPLVALLPYTGPLGALDPWMLCLHHRDRLTDDIPRDLLHWHGRAREKDDYIRR
jgi:hypothetical protein